MEDEESVSALEMMVGEDFFVMLHLTMFIPTIEVRKLSPVRTCSIQSVIFITCCIP